MKTILTDAHAALRLPERRGLANVTIAATIGTTIVLVNRQYREGGQSSFHGLIDCILEFQDQRLGAGDQADHDCGGLRGTTEGLRDMHGYTLGCRLDYQLSGILDKLFGFLVTPVRNTFGVLQFLPPLAMVFLLIFARSQEQIVAESQA